MNAATERKQYYVRNPIMLGEHKFVIRVVGYDDTKGKTAPYNIGRGHVIEIPATGYEHVVEKYAANKCIEPYDPKRHPDAILRPVEFASFENLPHIEDAKESDGRVSQASKIVDPTDVAEEKPVPKKKSNQASPIHSNDPRQV